MTFLTDPAHLPALLKLWKAELLVEEALGQNLEALKPEVAKNEGRNYFKLPLDLEANQAFFLRQSDQLQLVPGPEEIPFLKYLAKEDKARKRYRMPLDHEVWVGFPAFYAQGKGGKPALSSLFRFPLLEIKYPEIDPHHDPDQISLPDSKRIGLISEPSASSETAYFLDELFLSEKLGLLDEEILVLRRQALKSSKGGEGVVLALWSQILGTEQTTLDWSAFLADLGAALQKQPTRPPRLYPFGLAYELDQGQPTKQLQKDLEVILDEELTPASGSPAHAYLYGEHEEPKREAPIWAQVGENQLTESQELALMRGLTDRFSVVQGPPGTGKTEVIKNLLASRLFGWAEKLDSPDDRASGMQHLSLVTSTNNRAVDNALEGLEEPGLLPAHIRLGSRLMLSRQTLPFLSQYLLLLGQARPVEGVKDFHRLKADLRGLELEIKSPVAARRRYLLARQLVDAYARANQVEAMDLIEGLMSDIEGKRGLRAFKKPAVLEFLFSLFPLAGTTLLSLRNGFEMDTQSLGLVVIDEAGQCSPHYLLPALMRAKRAVLFGDVRQLEPVARLRILDIQNLKKQRSIDLNEEQTRFFSTTSEQPRSAQHIAQEAVKKPLELVDHFRCRPDIIGVCEDLCGYHLNLADRPPSVTFGPALGYREVIGQEQRYGGSWQNLAEVEAVVDLLRRFNGFGWDWGQLAVLTPFRGQLVFIEQALTRAGIPHHSGEGQSDQLGAVSTGTVHRFQGGERKVVLFSGVIAQGEPNFLNSRVNLLNVALSRAQDHFVFIGSLSALAKGTYTAILLDHLQKKGVRG